MTYITRAHTHTYAHVASHVTLCTKLGKEKEGGLPVGCTNFTVSESLNMLTHSSAWAHVSPFPTQQGQGERGGGVGWQAAQTKWVMRMTSLGGSEGAGKCRRGGTQF